MAAIGTVNEGDIAARRIRRLSLRRAQAITKGRDIRNRHQRLERCPPADETVVTSLSRHAGPVSRSRIVYTLGSQR
jgi:hypothetical protein